MKIQLFDFTYFPILQTKRLILRELDPQDAADVLVIRGDPIVQKFDDPIIQTKNEALSFIQEFHVEFKANQGINWAASLIDQEEILGLMSFHFLNLYHRRAEIGYGFAHKFWGKGFATESMQAILQFGFGQLNLNRIYARTIADNHESVRLLRRNGFKLEGLQRQHSWEDDGTFHDSAIYGLLRHEFNSPNLNEDQ
jgi:ribosomal-protein-alanine N-acetyltransferase